MSIEMGSSTTLPNLETQTRDGTLVRRADRSAGSEAARSKYLFILSPPFSGSTVLQQLLRTSAAVSGFKVEGQMLPTVKDIMMERWWDPNKKMPWPTIKAEWEKIWDLSKPILLEKSPSNILRAFDIQKYFEPAYFVAIIRNPYAFCEGCNRRRGRGVTRGAQQWVRSATFQRENIEGLDRVLSFTYEEFTEDPAGITQRLIEFLPQLGPLDVEREFKAVSVSSLGKARRKLQNLNQVKIEQLSAGELSDINGVLAQHMDIMNYFGYELLDPATTEARGSSRQGSLAVQAVKLLYWFRRLRRRLSS